MPPLKRVRGFPDRLSEEMFQWDSLLLVITEVLKTFHFDRVDPPILEYSELFSRTLGKSSDIVNKEMYTFQQGEDSLTLRPEGTASIARMFLTEKLQKNLPLKWYYYGPMFRHERPQKGRFRQFYQIGVELLGEEGIEADVEIISMAWILFKKLNLEKKIVLEINSLGQVEEREIYKKELTKYLQDFKGQLSADSQTRLEKNPLRIWDSKEAKDQEILKQAPLLKNYLKEESLNKYERVKKLLKLLEIPFKEQNQLVRGLDYYTDLVFEFTSTELGAQSTVLAGGRYDGLIESLGASKTPAVGWAMGIERLNLLCEVFKKETSSIGLVASGGEASRKAFQLAYELRSEGYQVYHRFSGNFSKQMKRIGQKCLFALIYGGKEQDQKQIILKNLKSGDQNHFPVSLLKEELKKIF